MKTSLLILAAALLALPLLAQTRPVPVSPSANYEVSARSLDSRTWQRRETKTVNGRSVPQTNSFVELATGLSKWDSLLGQVVDCDPTIAIAGKNAVITGTRHQAVIAGSILAANGTVDLLDQNGQRFAWRPLGLCYFAGEQAVMIAEAQESAGVLATPTRVDFPDCMDGGFACTLELHNSLAGLSQ